MSKKLDLATCSRQELVAKIDRQRVQLQDNSAHAIKRREDYLSRFMALEEIKKDLTKLLKRTDTLLAPEAPR